MKARLVRVWAHGVDSIALAPGERVDRMEVDSERYLLVFISQTATREVADRAAAIFSEGLRRLAVRLGVDNARDGAS